MTRLKGQSAFRRRGAAILRGACLAVSFLLVPEAALADNVTVDCTGATPGAFTSLNDAIQSLDRVGPHFITVVSDCTENVSIIQRDRITITVPMGQTATITALNPSGSVLAINGSRNITLFGLVIRGGNAGIVISRGSTVQIQGCRVTENTGVGVVLNQSSFLALGGGLATQFVEVDGNGGPGINSTGSGLLIAGFLTVVSNGGSGIIIGESATTINGNQGGNLVQSNGGTGIGIIGSVVNFIGMNTIQNNGGVGISVANGGATFGGGLGPDGVLRVTTIEGHSLGMNIASAAGVSFAGPHRIRNNGMEGLTGPFRGGIRVGTVSRIQFNGGEVTGNIGHGVFADFNGSVSINGTTITGNTEDGVRVTRQSTAGFGPGNSITGNGRADVSCETTSLIFGDLTGVSNIDCRSIERQHGPPRPGAIHEIPAP